VWDGLSLQSIRRHLLHRLVALICLLSTGFHAVAGGFVVECKESDGNSHPEFGGCREDETSRCMK